MNTAAIALTLGYSDPLSLLALSGHDLKVAVAVINRAAEVRADYDERLAKYSAIQTTNFMAPLFSALKKQISRIGRG